MGLNKAQRAALWVGGLAIVVLLVFPPTNRARYKFVFSQGGGMLGADRVLVAQVVLRCLAVAGATGLAVGLLRGPRRSRVCAYVGVWVVVIAGCAALLWVVLCPLWTCGPLRNRRRSLNRAEDSKMEAVIDEVMGRWRDQDTGGFRRRAWVWERPGPSAELCPYWLVAWGAVAVASTLTAAAVFWGVAWSGRGRPAREDDEGPGGA